MSTTFEILIAPDHRWHHLAVVIKDGPQIIVYLDGRQNPLADERDRLVVDVAVVYDYAVPPERIAAHAADFLEDQPSLREDGDHE